MSVVLSNGLSDAQSHCCIMTLFWLVKAQVIKFLPISSACRGKSSFVLQECGQIFHDS